MNQTPQRQASRGGTSPTQRGGSEAKSVSKSPPLDETPRQQQLSKGGGDEEVISLWGVWEMWVERPIFPTSGPGKRGTAKKNTSAPSGGTVMGDWNQQRSSWIDTVRSLGMFDTAEGFWGIHDCTLPPSRLPNGSNYYMFRHNICPMWEHEANRRGGKWVLAFETSASADFDAAWTSICAAMIGEQYPGLEEEICGCVASKRKGTLKLAVWTRNAHDQKAQTGIGFFLKVLLGLKTQKLNYLEHGTVLGSIAHAPTGESPLSATAVSPPAFPQNPPTAGGGSPESTSPNTPPTTPGAEVLAKSTVDGVREISVTTNAAATFQPLYTL